jgi:hypothetical protein
MQGKEIRAAIFLITCRCSDKVRCVRVFDSVEIRFALDENDLSFQVQIVVCGLTFIVISNVYNSYGVSSYI